MYTATTAIKTNGAFTFMPNQIVEDFSNEDYVNTLRWIGSRWNQPVYTPTNWSLPQAEIGLPLGFASRSMIWRDYYFGIQRNIDYPQLNINVDGSRLLSKAFRGKDIFKYVNYTLEPFIDITKRIPKILMCNTVSENVVSKRRFALDVGNFMVNQQEFLQYMNEKYGVYMKTPSGVKFVQNAQEQTTTVDFRENLADGATNVAKDVYYRNRLDEYFVELGKDALVTGVAGCKVSVVDGYVLVENIPSVELIFSVTINGDQHRQDPIGGRLRFMTVQEVAALYGDKMTHEALIDIQSIAQSGDSASLGSYGWTYYNDTVGLPNFNWYSLVAGVPRIAVVEGQWASWSTDAMGKHKQCLRQGVLIGNKYLVENEITTNMTQDWRNPVTTDLDYLVCQPMSVFGKNMGIPEILYTYQNQIDFLQTKINFWVNQTKGTFYLINGSYIDPTTDAIAIMSEISDTRIHVMKGTDIDAGDAIEKFMQQGAIEMPKDVINIINQIAVYEHKMADVLNIPDAARGIMEGYVPQKTLNTQIGQSGKGTRYFYDPMFTFYQRIFQKAVDKFKTATLDNKDFEYTLIVGDSQVELFKATKEFGTSEYAVYMGFDDIVDDGYKQHQLDLLMTVAQNPASGYTMTDFNTIEGMYTKTEINNFLQFRDFEIAQQRAAEAQAAKETAMLQAAAANQTQQNIAQDQVKGSLQNTAIKEDGANARQQEQIFADHVSNERALAEKPTT